MGRKPRNHILGLGPSRLDMHWKRKTIFEWKKLLNAFQLNKEKFSQLNKQTILQDNDGCIFPQRNQPFSKQQTEIVYFPKY